jgi:hypothetical protein
MHTATAFSILALTLTGACRSTPESSQIAFEHALRGQLGFSLEAKNAVVKSAEEWRALCNTNSAGLAAPAASIDWSKQMLITVSLGSRPSGGYSVEIDRVTQQGSLWIVHAHESRPAEGSMQTQMITSPFDCVSTPRFEGRIVFSVE